VADLVRLAHYPFLPEVRDAVRQEGPDLAALLSAPLYSASRARAAERVKGALGEGIPPPRLATEREALLELLSVPLARMLVVELDEGPLVTRYAAAEARLAAEHLARDDASALEAAAAALGIAVERDGDTDRWRLHVAEYLQRAPLGQSGWKLVLRTVSSGTVTLTPSEVVGLLREGIQRRIATELEAERRRPLPGEVVAALAPLVSELEPALEEARAAWTSGDFGPVQPGLFPPCMQAIFGELKENRNVPHHGRFAFATFLHTVGWNAEQILDYLAATPNFDREKSRYQIEHVTGQKGVEAYMVPNCSTMQTNGVCPLEARDGICFMVKNPLGYYRRRLRLQARAQPQTAGPATAPTAPVPPQNS